MRLALFMIVVIALLHKAGMFSKLDGSGSCNTSLTCVWACFVYWGSVVVITFVAGLGSMFLAVFLSRAMRFNCLVHDFVMGGCSFMCVSLVGG